ncbi:p115 like vesicle tethering protein [Xylogone sp. PMI_703]|nr:p115 like vesicle tethering protein [Xylogone sp. PMI_703]
MFTIATAPAKQSVSETIATLSSRLSSATLLEDRRAAILGLRSFAKEYPASVASGALRGLIGSLSKDGEDVDTVKIVLETLLMLFKPNETSPEASEEIALWLADEFTQRQDNITLLLDFLDTSDFYSRLYSLQLLSAILSSRTERTEECIFTAPLGISRLVAALDDRREIVRNEALSLLTYLTPNSSELQKLVAFENAFDRIFNIIKEEGSLSQGDRIVEDCLILLANLLRLNVSNQSFFRETGCVVKLSQLLGDAVGGHDVENEVAEWVQVQRNRNIYALLEVLRLFLVSGNAGTLANQASFWQHGILDQVLQLAFSHSVEMHIKAEALITCADLIRGHPGIQEGFAQFQVNSVIDVPPANGTENASRNGVSKVYVIDGLLDLTLSESSLAAFDARFAACECIKAYFYNHPAIRLHFLRRAIDGHASGADETGNVLTTLLRPLDSQGSSDPYRYWFAGVLLFHLIFDDSEAKGIAMSVAEGDSSSGEEVVTCIQTITANLIIGTQRGLDERLLVAYLMLLSGWLFEDPDGVNDFLGEGSNIQSLLQIVISGSRYNVITQGLCSLLIGIIYEFSTKDSPVPRATIHHIISSRMGREQYIDHLTRLRNHPLLRDFEVLPQKLSSAPPGGLPEVYFDKDFVDFFKDNFSRLLRAIDRDPVMEIPVTTNGIQKGISRELVDSLRSQLEEKEQAMQKAEEEIMSLRSQLGQERAESRKAKETAAVELLRIRNVNEALQNHHEEDIKKLQAEHARVIEDYRRQLDHVQRTAEANADRMRKKMEAENADLQSNVKKLEASLEKANKNHIQDLQTAHEEHVAKQTEQAKQMSSAQEQIKDLEIRVKEAATKLSKAEVSLVAKEEEKQAVQSELDDLLMVFGDLEEKANKYKDRLRALGEDVSDGEAGDENSEDDGELD